MAPAPAPENHLHVQYMIDSFLVTNLPNQVQIRFQRSFEEGCDRAAKDEMVLTGNRRKNNLQWIWRRTQAVMSSFT